MIEVRGLTRYYGRNKDVTKALDDVDFTLDDSGIIEIRNIISDIKITITTKSAS